MKNDNVKIITDHIFNHFYSNPELWKHTIKNGGDVVSYHYVMTNIEITIIFFTEECSPTHMFITMFGDTTSIDFDIKDEEYDNINDEFITYIKLFL